MPQAKLTIVNLCNVMGRPVAAERLSEEHVQRSVLRILQKNVLCSIATVTTDNRAHINTAYFCYSDELELYFLSHPGSLHCQNLSTNSSMAMTIFSSSQKWVDADQGLQLFGTCSQARGRQAGKAKQLYGERFPAYASWKASLARDNVAGAYRFYRFLTTNLKLLDERNIGDALFVYVAVKRSRHVQ